MHSCYTAPPIISGVFKSVLCNALAGLLCNEFNTLYDSIDDLKTHNTYTASGLVIKKKTFIALNLMYFFFQMNCQVIIKINI